MLAKLKSLFQKKSTSKQSVGYPRPKQQDPLLIALENLLPQAKLIYRIGALPYLTDFEVRFSDYYGSHIKFSYDAIFKEYRHVVFFLENKLVFSGFASNPMVPKIIALVDKRFDLKPYAKQGIENYKKYKEDEASSITNLLKKYGG